MMWEKLKKIAPRVEKALIFMIALGLGESTRRIALWFGTTSWLDLMFVVTKVGVVAYIFWLGVERWAIIFDIEESARKHHGISTGRCTAYKMYPLMYWTIAVITALVMF